VPFGRSTSQNLRPRPKIATRRHDLTTQPSHRLMASSVAEVQLAAPVPTFRLPGDPTMAARVSTSWLTADRIMLGRAPTSRLSPDPTTRGHVLTFWPAPEPKCPRARGPASAWSPRTDEGSHHTVQAAVISPQPASSRTSFPG